jgi:signal transduction histidine kinase
MRSSMSSGGARRRLLAGTLGHALTGGIVPIGTFPPPQLVCHACRMGWISAAMALAGVVAALTVRRLRGWVTGVVAAASLIVTYLAVPGRPDGWGLPATLAVVELLALLGLVVLLVRSAPVAPAVFISLVAAVAVAMMVLRFASPRTFVEAAGMCGLWALGALLAAAGGLYLRLQDERKQRSVADARQAQRLEIAHDLHDFVAHHVSEMVAQAQAAQVAGGSDPAYAAGALADIERAGLRALTALDHSVHVLRNGTPAGSRPGLAELAELCEHFAGVKVNLAIRAGLVGEVPAELGNVTYRIVVEALTNVRRHAPAATTVSVSVASAGDGLEVVVADDGGAAAEPGSGRSGLRGLAERVEALGGTFTAGPGQTGWSVTARLPWAPP